MVEIIIRRCVVIEKVISGTWTSLQVTRGLVSGKTRKQGRRVFGSPVISHLVVPLVAYSKQPIADHDELIALSSRGRRLVRTRRLAVTGTCDSALPVHFALSPTRGVHAHDSTTPRWAQLSLETSMCVTRRCRSDGFSP